MTRFCITFLIKSKQYNDTPSRSVPCLHQARKTNPKCGIRVTTNSVNYCLLNPEYSKFTLPYYFSPRRPVKPQTSNTVLVSIRSKSAVKVTCVSKVTLQYKVNKILATMFLNLSHLFFFTRSSHTENNMTVRSDTHSTLIIKAPPYFTLI